MTRRLVWLSALVLLLAPGCAGVKQGFEQVTTLQSALASEYPGEAVRFRILNGRVLALEFVNSKKRDLPEDERKQEAEGIARFALARLPGNEAIETVIVVFLHESHYGPVRTSDGTVSYRFTASTLSPAPSPKGGT